MKIKSLASVLPQNHVFNHDLADEEGSIQKIIHQTGIDKRHVVLPNVSAITLGKEAAIKAIGLAKINLADIGVLVLVTQYPSYLLPSTAHILQHELGLEQNTVAIQINQGCAGFLYGLHCSKALLSASSKPYALLITTDTTSRITGQDMSIVPLFGDGAAACILSKEEDIHVTLGSDGSGYEDIIVRSGFNDGFQSKPQLEMNGINVFSFSISKIPKQIQLFLESESKSISDYDHIVLHQANKMMNDRIIRKIGGTEVQALESISHYGNTSVASIPITITHHISGQNLEKDFKLLICGFGVGLSWGVGSLSIEKEAVIEHCFL